MCVREREGERGEKSEERRKRVGGGAKERRERSEERDLMRGERKNGEI